MKSCGPKNFKFHAWIKKCHFSNFSERAGMAEPCQSGSQESLTGFQKFFLFWVPLSSQQCWEARLERPYFLKVQSGKITVWVLGPVLCWFSCWMSGLWSIVTPNQKLHDPPEPNMYRMIKHDILFSISFLFYSVNDEVEPVERPQVFWGLYGAGFHVGWAGFGRLSRGDHSYITS